MTDEDKAMRLPDSKTCADCVHARRCVAFGFSWPTRTRCDFYPSSYEPKITPSTPALALLQGEIEAREPQMVLNQDARSGT